MQSGTTDCSGASEHSILLNMSRSGFRKQGYLEEVQGTDDALQGQVEGGGGLVLAAGVQGHDLAHAVDDRRAAAATFCPRCRLQVDCARNTLNLG